MQVASIPTFRVGIRTRRSANALPRDDAAESRETVENDMLPSKVWESVQELESDNTKMGKQPRCLPSVLTPSGSNKQNPCPVGTRPFCRAASGFALRSARVRDRHDGSFLRRGGEAHDERRTVAACALHFELAAGTSDDMAGLIGADAHPNLALGAVERPEQAVAHERLVHAAAGVRHGDHVLAGPSHQADADAPV